MLDTIGTQIDWDLQGLTLKCIGMRMFINYRLSHHPLKSFSTMLYGSSHSPCIPTIRS